MKPVGNIIIISVFSFLIASCNTPSSHANTHMTNFIHREQVVKTTKENYPAKNPQTVAIYSTYQEPHMPYRVIGYADVAKHNLFGIERHDETIQKMMQQLAASIGGDGLINVNSTNTHSTANIIAFQRILI